MENLILEVNFVANYFMSKKELPPLNYNDSWKMIMNIWLNPAIKFFLPKIHNVIDWNKEYVYLEDELQKLSSNDKSLRVDKLIQFKLLNDKKLLLLLHIEIQSHSPQTIAQRMFNYSIKLRIKYPTNELVSFILYIGKEKYKDIHIYQPFQYSKSLQYVGEYYVLAEHSEDELINSKSLIGYVLLLNLWINNQRKSGQSRIYFLKRYLDFLRSKKLSKIDLEKLFQFVELLVTLPEELKNEYQEIKNQQINYMANIVVTPERLRAFDETLSYLFSTGKTKEDILLEGKLEGEQKGLQKGKFEGEQIGLYKGKLEGKIEGEQVGLRKGEYQKALETAKKLRAKGTGQTH